MIQLKPLSVFPEMPVELNHRRSYGIGELLHSIMKCIALAIHVELF